MSLFTLKVDHHNITKQRVGGGVVRLSGNMKHQLAPVGTAIVGEPIECKTIVLVGLAFPPFILAVVMLVVEFLFVFLLAYENKKILR